MTDSYHLDLTAYSLEQLGNDLQSRELIPSRKPLLEGLEEKLSQLNKAGITNLQELLDQLKTKARLVAFAKEVGLDPDYLNLLRREVSSYLPNPVSLEKFTEIKERDLQQLRNAGIKNSRQLYDRIKSDGNIENLSEQVEVPGRVIAKLFRLSDLVRAYGVGPVFARLLYDTGIQSISELKTFTPEGVIQLYEEQTGKKADFSVSDISFSLNLARILQPEE
jgi:hypothetical protein